MQGATSSVQKDTVLRLTYYEIFSLDPSAATIDLAAVQRSYRRFALLFHPDKDPSPEAREAFLRIKLAAETLADPERRREYNERLQQEERAHQQWPRQCGTSRSTHSQKEREMEEEAAVADMILKQKEAEALSRAAAARKDEAEREAAAKQMLHELTNALTTPFKQMETILVHEWDIDEELLEMKTREVQALLHKLNAFTKSVSRKRGAVSSSSSSKAVEDKRSRTCENAV
ncbi:DnaJ domain [Trypanosoma vivax]|uniref:Putative chaperone protein DNAj n=1 Tax=Trypanosoma vivax (strain Y486) TaxID=1055687 RepID=G0TRW1_TRYVY|nr:putative chaperone protein DNAj [Trypanosoma vivax]KAH8617407.1 DnaJ domain [Trypanosoma vivax]CCC46684.1 putative chaperone protein DNAj [Trypanosoma vivax Y486]